MELSERCIQTLEKEGFTSVYEVQDAPDSLYPAHTHEGEVTIFVTEGSFTVSIAGKETTLQSGDRFSIPLHTLYTGIVGPKGSQIIVGEMIAGDF